MSLAADDLRAGVEAGILTEAQAASLKALAEKRAGYRQSMPAEDEPFELFRGFSEIFVTIGLSILLFAAFGLLALMGGAPSLLVGVPLCAGLAQYFTLRRRMVLPSILLTAAFALSVGTAASGVIPWQLDGGSSGRLLLALIVTAGALLLWFRYFRVPFTMFLVGLCGLGAILVATRTLVPGARWSGAESLDLTNGSGMGLAMLAFGLLALAGGIWFDMRDPHRLGRQSASGFWLHVLAAPALVNTLAMTFFRMGPGAGYLALTVVLVLATLLAVVIDRRSFLTAGLGYMIFLVVYVFGSSDLPMSWLGTLLLIGVALTAIGAGWTQLRGRVMQALPAFPGKDRLPPWQ